LIYFTHSLSAHAIGLERRKKPIETTMQLASLIESVRPKGKSKYLKSLEPCKKIFQALRIYVNEEVSIIPISSSSSSSIIRPPLTTS
jgi:16S rRNA (cytosine1402-N4)-methyltransferase